MTRTAMPEQDDRKKANLRLALILASIVAAFFVVSMAQSFRQVQRTQAEHHPDETDDDEA